MIPEEAAAVRARLSRLAGWGEMSDVEQDALVDRMVLLACELNERVAVWERLPHGLWD